MPFLLKSLIMEISLYEVFLVRYSRKKSVARPGVSGKFTIYLCVLQFMPTWPMSFTGSHPSAAVPRSLPQFLGWYLAYMLSAEVWSRDSL